MDNAQLVALSRQSALLRQFEVLANNFANIDTTGFKQRDVKFEEYLMPKAKADEERGLARRISFVADRSITLDMSDGDVNFTGNPLDVALRGNTLLAVNTKNGERYTRSGALSLNREGQLITADGHLVLGADSQPIATTPDNAPLSITKDGMLVGSQGTIAKLKIVQVPKPEALVNEGRNLYSSKTKLSIDERPEVVPGALEKSNVVPVLSMSRMIEINRSYSTLAAIMQKLDERSANAIDRLSSVPN